MRTGFDLLDDGEEDAMGGFLSKVANLLLLLKEDSLRTAVRFARACGRVRTTQRDILLALKYETHEFLNREDLMERYLDVCMRNGQEGEGEEEENDDVEDEEGEEEQEEEESDESGEKSDVTSSTEEATEEEEEDLVDPSESDFYETVMRYDAEWDAWSPEEPVYALLKQSVDNTILHFRR